MPTQSFNSAGGIKHADRCEPVFGDLYRVEVCRGRHGVLDTGKSTRLNTMAEKCQTFSG